jgi:hypothetical protein
MMVMVMAMNTPGFMKELSSSAMDDEVLVLNLSALHCTALHCSGMQIYLTDNVTDSQKVQLIDQTSLVK